MEYLLTFKNGSSAFLAHHGVKGMHWGQWNAETQAKYGVQNPSAGAGGGGGGLEEDDEEKKAEEEFMSKAPEKLDTDKFGFENSKEGRKAAYMEAGFDPKWSRERGLEETKKNFVKALMPGPDTAKDFKTRAETAFRRLGWDIEMTRSLKTEKQKKDSKAWLPKKTNDNYSRDIRSAKEDATDHKEYKTMIKRTNDYYGKNGKKAQKKEIKRRKDLLNSSWKFTERNHGNER